jgi:MFS family permease
MLLAALGSAFIPLAPSGLPIIAIGFLVLQQLVADSAETVYDVTEVSVRQALVEDRALGRVSSTFHVSSAVAQLVATLVAGVLAEVIGLRATAWLGPLGGLAGAAILFWSPVRRLIVLPTRRGGTDAGEDGDGEMGDRRTPAEVVVEVERDQPVGG